MSLQSVAITIGGVDKTTLIEEPADFEVGFNGSIGIAHLRLTDDTGAYTPAADAVVEITVGGTLRWAGEIAQRECGEYNETAGKAWSLVCHDNNELLERGIINTILPAGTLKAALQYMTDPGGALHALGVTLDAAQVTGPSLGVLTAAWMTPKQFLDYLRTLTGYVDQISATKVLKMWAPGTVSSGVTISRANENYIDATWTDQRLDYRNRQWVVYGPNEIRDVTETWVGDGSTRTFPVKYQCASNPGVLAVNGTSKPVGTYGVDTMEWTWDAALTNTSYGTTGGFRQDAAFAVLTGSDTLTANHPSQFPNVVFVQDAAEVTARGEWNKAVANPDIVDVDEAEDYGTSLIRANVGRPTIPWVQTTEDGITNGSTVVVNLSHLGLSSVTSLVQKVSASLRKADDQVWAVYDLDLVGAVAGAYEARPTDDDLWGRAVSGSASGSLAVGSGGGSGGGSTTVINGVRSHVWQNARSARAFSASWVTLGDYLPFVADTDTPVSVLIAQITNNAGGSVQARIYDETAAAAVAGTTTSATTSTSWSESTVIFTPTVGHRYVLQVIGGSANVGVGAVALS